MIERVKVSSYLAFNIVGIYESRHITTRDITSNHKGSLSNTIQGSDDMTSGEIIWGSGDIKLSIVVEDDVNFDFLSTNNL